MGRKSKNNDAELEQSITDTAPAPKHPEKNSEDKVIEIRAAALKDHFFCNYSYDHTVAPETTNTVSIKSQVPVHQDMKECFKKLDAHLAVICDEVAASEIRSITTFRPKDPVKKKLELFSVRAFKLDDYNYKEGVILIGEKQLSIGGAVGLTTPKIMWTDDKYPFVEELRIAITECIIEVEAYMNGKQADPEDDGQPELPFDSNAGDYKVSLYANPEAMARVAAMEQEGEAPYVETDL